MFKIWRQNIRLSPPNFGAPTNIYQKRKTVYKTKKASEQRLLCGMYLILTIFYLIKKLKDILSKSPLSGTLKIYKTKTLF